MAKKGAGDFLGAFPTPSGGQPWPVTVWQVVRRAQAGTDDDRAGAREYLLQIYYKPVHRFFERVLGLHDDRLDDVTQGFFARFIEKDFLKNITYQKSFRHFLQLACRRHYINWLEAERARWGRVVPLEDLAEERSSALLDEELRRWYLEETVARLGRRLASDGKPLYFEIFQARVTFDGTRATPYDELARRFGIGVFDVRNHLTAARKAFREILGELAQERSKDPRGELQDLDLLKYL